MFTILQAGAEQAQPNMLMTFLPFVLMIGVLYFLIIRPQKKRQKEHKDMLDNLKKHQKVVTSSGIFGTIVNIKSDRIVLRIDETTKAKIEVQKSAVTGVLKDEKDNS